MEYFNHTELISRLDEMSKELEDLIDQLLKTRVRCHILEVELCTQFSPYIMEAIHNSKINCEECSQQTKAFLVPSEEEQEEINTSSSSNNLPISSSSEDICNKNKTTTSQNNINGE